ncbi:hypothetical protein L209DRAFT_505236 [Thermothelomyces heterothallicus CBS 203.75]
MGLLAFYTKVHVHMRKAGKHRCRCARGHGPRIGKLLTRVEHMRMKRVRSSHAVHTCPISKPNPPPRDTIWLVPSCSGYLLIGHDASKRASVAMRNLSGSAMQYYSFQYIVGRIPVGTLLRLGSRNRRKKKTPGRQTSTARITSLRGSQPKYGRPTRQDSHAKRSKTAVKGKKKPIRAAYLSYRLPPPCQ